MRVRYPRTPHPSAVDVAGHRQPVADDGTFAIPDTVGEAWLGRFADAHDTTPDALIVESGPPFDPGDYTVDELRERVPDDDVGASTLLSAADLDAAIESERATDARTTALDALRAWRDDLDTEG